MSLKDIRAKNLKKDSFVNDFVNYNLLSDTSINLIRKDCFEKLVKPNTYKMLKKLKPNK